jgi:hypothetical protein
MEVEALKELCCAGGGRGMGRVGGGEFRCCGRPVASTSLDTRPTSDLQTDGNMSSAARSSRKAPSAEAPTRASSICWRSGAAPANRRHLPVVGLLLHVASEKKWQQRRDDVAIARESKSRERACLSRHWWQAPMVVAIVESHRLCRRGILSCPRETEEVTQPPLHRGTCGHCRGNPSRETHLDRPPIAKPPM